MLLKSLISGHPWDAKKVFITQDYCRSREWFSYMYQDTKGVNHRRTGQGGEGGEGGCSPPKFWATQIFWAARENLGKASF